MKTTRIQTIALVTFGFCLCPIFAGCNVGGLFQDRQPPPGAVTANPGGSAEVGSPVDIVVADAREVDLVEAVVKHRLAYHRSLEQLRTYYDTHGYAHKESWAAFELKGLKSVKAFRYLLDAEVPGSALRPETSIEEADALYEKGLELMRHGGHGVPALYREDLMIEAAQVFRGLIEKYPGSDKIDDAAFMCGEIHKEYLPNQELLAVKWYERAWNWDPNTPHPARFQAAVVYDYRLHDRDRALELYHHVLRHETSIGRNIRFATRRIRELTANERTSGDHRARADRRTG